MRERPRRNVYFETFFYSGIRLLMHGFKPSLAWSGQRAFNLKCTKQSRWALFVSKFYHSCPIYESLWANREKWDGRNLAESFEFAGCFTTSDKRSVLWRDMLINRGNVVFFVASKKHKESMRNLKLWGKACNHFGSPNLYAVHRKRAFISFFKCVRSFLCISGTQVAKMPEKLACEVACARLATPPKEFAAFNYQPKTPKMSSILR